jgi:class 3 adenylate cyclase/DNA-binding CsgD family transcriptional regulator/tetratricopeptide (TPR) repeat protein
MTRPAGDSTAPGQPAVVRTFLIADIRGYTRFTQERGDEAAARLAGRFAEIVQEGLEAGGGELVELRGDEALGVFASARQAIRAAVELQEVLDRELDEGSSFPLGVGMGLDAGEAVPVADGYRGGALNLAARLCARAGAGEVLASQGVIHLARTMQGIGFEPLEPLVLKGLAQPVAAVRVVADRHREQRPRPRPPARRGELSPGLDPSGPLVGRDGELRWLRWGWRRVLAGQGRVLSLSGRSGMGKTRLAAELARGVHAAGWPVLHARCAGPAPAALKALEEASSAPAPILVVADDLDLATGTVLDALDALLQRVEAGDPIMVVGTHRDNRSPLVSVRFEQATSGPEHRRRLARVAGPFPSPLAPAVQAGMAGGFTPEAFIGRAAELGRLEGALDRAEQGRPQLVLLAGDAGVGKTRLLVEFADRARQRGSRVVAGGCVELGDIGIAYLPVADALRGLADEPADAELLAQIATTAPGLGRLLPEIVKIGTPGALAGDGLDQLQLFDAMRAVLMARAERSPVVLVLEDLHWADRASRDLVAFLARTMWSGRVMLVASYRSDELHRRHPLRPLLAELVRLPGVERLELAPFSRAELAEHLEAITGEPLPVNRVQGIYARSEGNPFYAEQLLAVRTDDAQVELPATLADVLLARVQTLTEPAQQVLRVLAVAGRRVPHRLLAEVTGWPEADLEGGLREAIGAGVLVTETTTGGYAFRHALLQEAVYGDLLPGEQVRLHAAYARVLAGEAEGAAAELAHHCLASNDLVGALAASVQAAEEAAAVLAPAEVLRHLTSALKLWEPVPDPTAVTGTDRVELTLRAAEAASAAGDEQRAVSLTQDAATTADATADPARAARAYERLGSYLLGTGRVEDALRARARAVELVPAQPPTPLRARVTAAMAQALFNARRRNEARRWCEEALMVARGVGSADDEADVLITLGMIQQYDDPAQARSLYAAGRARAADAGSPEIELRALQNLAWLEYKLGDLTATRATCDDGVELAERTGLGWSRIGIGMRRTQCIVCYRVGAWDECERLAGAVPERVMTLAAQQLAAEGLAVQVARGRSVASKRLHDLVALAGASQFLDGDVAVREAELATWQGDLDRARSAIHRALAAIDAVEHLDKVMDVAWICMKGLTVEAERAERARTAGDTVVLTDAIAVGGALLERAHSAVEQAHRAGINHDVHVRGWLAKADAEWTRLQGHSDPARWQAAVDAFSYGHVYAVARCQWRLAEALLGAGDREQATAAARAAHQTAVQLEAVPLQAVLEALARRGRLDLGAGLPTERTLAGLTPRELEVLRLLVEGRSNRQIAEQLFISGKTASVHVTNLMAKLGVHSRLEAAAMARRLGLDQSAQERAAI